MDRRSRKTRAQLMQAVIELMQECHWDDITVQQICARADIARSTFYLHFADKSELLAYGFRHLESLIKDAPRDRNLDADLRFGVVPVLVRMLATPNHAFLFGQLSSSGAAHLAREHLRVVIADLLREELAASSQLRDMSPLAVDFIAGGLYAAVEAWHRQSLPLTVDDLIAEIDGTVGHVLVREGDAIVGRG